MARSPRMAICSTILLAASFGVWHAVSSNAQSGPVVHDEHWPELGLDPHELVFANGFRIVVIEDHRVPRVAASLQYRFGALSERNGEHGSAHFLEHAMHQGTTTVGVKDRERDRQLLREIYDTEQELLAERNAHRNEVRERNVFFDEGDWPATEKEQRLRQKLYALEDEQAKNRIFGSPNTLTIQARAGRDDDLGALERIGLDAIERLRREQPDETGLRRVRREFDFDWALLRSERGALATQLGSFAIADDWRTLRSHYQRRSAATADEVRRAAERYLVAWNRVVATTRRNPQPRAEKNIVHARVGIPPTAERAR